MKSICACLWNRTPTLSPPPPPPTTTTTITPLLSSHSDDVPNQSVSELAFNVLFDKMNLYLRHGQLSELDVKDLFSLSLVNKRCMEKSKNIWKSLVTYITISRVIIQRSLNIKNNNEAEKSNKENEKARNKSLQTIDKFLVNTCVKIKKSQLPLCIDDYDAMFDIVKNNYAKLLELFISSVININFLNVQNKSKTLLMQATQLEDTRCLSALIRAGADVSARAPWSFTALMYALSPFETEEYVQRKEHVQMLLSAGASPIIHHPSGHCPLSLSMESGPEVTSMIISAIANSGHIDDAHCCYGRLKLGKVIDLMESDSDEEVEGSESDSDEEDEGNDEAIESLSYTQGTCGDADCIFYGKTPLMKVLDNIEYVRMCLGAGADINATDRGGKTALMWAALKGNHEVVQLLIGAGADVNIRNEGRTALEHAKKNLPRKEEESLPHEDSILHAFSFNDFINPRYNPMKIVKMLENVGAIE